MNLARVWAIILRHIWLFFEINRITWIFYWPLVDMTMWGFTGMWVQQGNIAQPLLAQALITGMVFWQMTMRASFEISMGLLEELWSFNMLNLFSTPLKLREWIVAMIILAIINCSIITLYCSLLAWFMYDINIMVSGWQLSFFSIPIFITGLAMSCFASAIVIYFGARVQSLVWIMSWLFAPFSGALYPIEVLPQAGQLIAQVLPLSYAFQGIRLLVIEHTFSAYHFWTSTIMGSIYLGLIMWYFYYMFIWSKQKGFARLTVD